MLACAAAKTLAQAAPNSEMRDFYLGVELQSISLVTRSDSIVRINSSTNALPGLGTKVSHQIGHR